MYFLMVRIKMSDQFLFWSKLRKSSIWVQLKVATVQVRLVVAIFFVNLNLMIHGTVLVAGSEPQAIDHRSNMFTEGQAISNSVQNHKIVYYRK